MSTLRRCVFPLLVVLVLLALAACGQTASPTPSKATQKPAATAQNTLAPSTPAPDIATQDPNATLAPTLPPTQNPNATPTPTPGPVDTYGRAVGNMQNYGFGDEQYGTAYFMSRAGGKGSLKKLVFGQKQSQTIVDGGGYESIIIDGNTVYCNYNEGEMLTGLFSIDLIKKTKTKLTKRRAYYMQLDGNNVLFADAACIGTYSISKDGLGEHPISFEFVQTISLQGETLYYTTVKDNTISNSKIDGLFSVSVRGGTPKRISADQVGYFNILGDWIYYVDVTDSLVYKVKKDGTGKTKVMDQPVYTINVTDKGYLFYTKVLDSGAGEIHRCTLDGKDDKLLVKTQKPSMITILNGWVIYTVDGQFSDTWRCRTNGLDAMPG